MLNNDVENQIKEEATAAGFGDNWHGYAAAIDSYKKFNNDIRNENMMDANKYAFAVKYFKSKIRLKIHARWSAEKSTTDAEVLMAENAIGQNLKVLFGPLHELVFP